MQEAPMASCIGGPLDGHRLRRSRSFCYTVYGENGSRYVHVYYLIVGKFFYLGMRRQPDTVNASGH